MRVFMTTPSKPFLSLTRLLLLAVVALVLAAGIVWHQQRAEDEAARPEPAAVAAPAGIGALGRIEPRGRVIGLSHDAGPEGARIETLDIAEGQEISAGQRVAVFSEYGLKQAELAVLQARLPVLDAQLAEQRAVLDYNEAQKSRADKLVKDRALSKSEQEQLASNAAASRARVAALEAEIGLARADIGVAEENLRRTQLFSPVGGTVIKIRAWPGERLGDAGIADVADLTALDAVAEIYERDMPRITPGQRARVQVPGTDMAFEGEVRELGYQVMKNDLNDTDPLADRDNRVIEVRISLPPEAAPKLRHLIYMQVDVHIDG